jgi:transcriptional regulator with XRE-family HTH domain
MKEMTHLQELFIRNIRFYREKKGYNQTQFSVVLDISPNYLNAVENGKNFPSLDVLERMVNVLGILPYQLFLEHPVPDTGASFSIKNSTQAAEAIIALKQEIVQKLDTLARALKQ